MGIAACDIMQPSHMEEVSSLSLSLSLSLSICLLKVESFEDLTVSVPIVEDT
jgi:hypothetical protein